MEHRVFIYCRVSGHYDKREASLSTQEQACREYAASKGLAIAGAYHERHTSFHLWERPILSEIRSRIQKGEARSILVYELDRLVRDQVHAFVLHDELKRSGGRILCVVKEFEDTAFGKLLLSVESYQGEVERAKIKDRMMRGRAAKLAQGKLPGSAPPKYGYRFKKEGKVHSGIREIFEPEAVVVRRIFRRALEGGTAVQIAKELNADQVPTRGESTGRTRAARRWDNQSIYYVVHDPAYKGETRLVWQNDDSRRKLKRAEPVTIEGATPALVSEEDWNRVQVLMKERRTTLKAVREEGKVSLARGYVICGECGNRASLIYTRKKNAAGEAVFRYFYRCTSRKAGKGKHCGNKYIQESVLDEQAWGQIMDFLEDPDRILEEVNKREGIDARRETLDRSLRDLKDRLAVVDRGRERLVKLLAEDESDDVTLYQAELKRLKQERESLMTGVIDVEGRLEALQRIELDRELISTLQKGLTKLREAPMTVRRGLIERLGPRIYFNGDEVVVSVRGVGVSSSESIGRYQQGYTKRDDGVWISLRRQQQLSGDDHSPSRRTSIRPMMRQIETASRLLEGPHHGRCSVHQGFCEARTPAEVWPYSVLRFPH